MKRFYKVNDFMFVEIGFIKSIDKWYADLIDIGTHEIIETNDNTDKIKLIADIVKNNWFSSDMNNLSLFIEDILKY